MDFALLETLCQTPGIGGRERAVREVVRDALAPLVDETRVDALGNLIATRKGVGPRIMIAAHIDEIGFIVRYIDDDGFIRLQPVGGFDPRVLVAQRVLVHPREGDPISGALQPGTKPTHLLAPGEAKEIKLEDLFVDLGLPAEQVKERVSIGDMITLDRPTVQMGDNVVSKALDDRLGVYVMIEAVRAAARGDAEVVAVATTQEEVGSRGAVVAGYAIDPDICIALDLTIANDIPSSRPEDQVTRLGAGPAIKVFDTTQISNPGIVQHLRDVAEAQGMPFQLEVLNHGGTDASLIQRLRAGVTVATLSIPARYLHTVNETVAISDVERSVELLTAWLAEAHTRNYAAEV